MQKERNGNPKKRTSAKLKSESQPEIQHFNEDFGIKVEIAVDAIDKPKPQPTATPFTPNFSMGASELLLSYYSQPPSVAAMATSNSTDCKQEYMDLTGGLSSASSVVTIKEEKGCEEMQQDFHVLSDEAAAADEYDDGSDCDSDMSGQLKVVMVDEEQDSLATSRSDQEAVGDVAVSQSEKARFWREQLDTGNFKIRKSQRSGSQTPGQLVGTGVGSAPLLGKDKWAVKIKDTQTEAFYHLPVVQSLQETHV